MDQLWPRRRRIYLMRHGEVEYFEPGGKPFRPDEVPLTPRGEEQASAAGAFLANAELDRAFVSPLLRTMQTAQRVLAGRNVPIAEDKGIQEIAPGKLRDLPADPDRIRHAFVDAFGISLTREDRFLGGETFGSMLDRVSSFIERLLADPDWSNVLIVAHGGVNRAILTHALGVGLPGFGRLEQDPACVNVIDVDDAGRMLVRLLNFSPTNPAKSGHRLTTMEELLAHYLGWNVTAGD